jgi:hypothetical protein
LYSNTHLRDARIKVEKSFGLLFSIREAIPMAEINKKMDSDSELQASIMTLLAHWENMALAIESGIADNAVCRDMVGKMS